MSNWMTVRFVLTGRPEAPLTNQPGRVVLVHADHTFADLADCVDPAFGRWDLEPDHWFELPDRVVGSAAQLPDDADASDDLTLTEAGLRLGSSFVYEFDPDERWRHSCEITDHDADPFELYGDEPVDPVCVDGWGLLPDQYGRELEADSDDEFADEEPEERASSWEVVDRTLAARPTRPDHHALTRAVSRLRNEPDAWPHELVWAIAEVTPTTVPDDALAAWRTLASGMVDPADVDGTAFVDEVAALVALEPADWAGTVIELVRAGTGAVAEPSDLTRRVLACPEIEGDEPSEEDVEVVERGLTVALPLWEALGIVDHDHQLTPLGAWGLPEALRVAWTVDDREPVEHAALP